MAQKYILKVKERGQEKHHQINRKSVFTTHELSYNGENKQFGYCGISTATDTSMEANK